MRTRDEIIGTTSMAAIPPTGQELSPTNIGKPMVNMLPFEVRLVRLTLQEILRHTHRYPPSEKLHSEPGRSSPLKTRSMRFSSLIHKVKNVLLVEDRHNG